MKRPVTKVKAIRPSARLLLAAVMLGMGCGDSPSPSTPPGPPRAIVLFVIDTLRADHVGATGGLEGLTPNLDALAARSVVFEQAHATAPWTLPSVTSILTSTFPCEHAVVADGDRVSEAIPTLAEELRAGGYRTASIYENPYAGSMSGLDRGFDDAEQAFDTGRQTTGRRIDALGESDRFFLYIHTTDPHDPYQETVLGPEPNPAPKARKALNRKLQHLRRLTRVDWTAKRPVGSTDNSAKQERAMAELRKQRAEIRHLYAKDVARADHRLGEVVAALEERGLMRDALFVVVSDHGEEFDEHGGWQHDQSVYEELLRVPLIVHLPGDHQAGTRIDAVASGVDLMPTILAAAGIEARPPARGRNLLPLIEAGSATASERDAIRVTGMRINRKKYSRPVREARGEHNVVARQGPWKSIWNVDTDTSELYQLRDDPGETRNLARTHPERTAAMREASETWLAACQPAMTREPDADGHVVDPEARARLRALGYAD